MNRDEFPAGWDEARVQRLLAHDEGQSAEVVVEDEIEAEEVIEFRVSSPSPTELMATWKHLMHAHMGGPVEPKFLIEEVTNPNEIARARRQRDHARRNSDWLQKHWPELLPVARGGFIAVAGQEAFIGDSAEEVWAMAKAAHRDDDGIVDQYVRPEPGPRIYSLFGSGILLTV